MLYYKVLVIKVKAPHLFGCGAVSHVASSFVVVLPRRHRHSGHVSGPSVLGGEAAQDRRDAELVGIGTGRLRTVPLADMTESAFLRSKKESGELVFPTPSATGLALLGLLLFLSTLRSGLGLGHDSRSFVS